VISVGATANTGRASSFTEKGGNVSVTASPKPQNPSIQWSQLKVKLILNHMK